MTGALAATVRRLQCGLRSGVRHPGNSGRRGENSRHESAHRRQRQVSLTLQSDGSDIVNVLE